MKTCALTCVYVSHCSEGRMQNYISVNTYMNSLCTLCALDMYMYIHACMHVQDNPHTHTHTHTHTQTHTTSPGTRPIHKHKYAHLHSHTFRPTASSIKSLSPPVDPSPVSESPPQVRSELSLSLACFLPPLPRVFAAPRPFLAAAGSLVFAPVSESFFFRGLAGVALAGFVFFSSVPVLAACLAARAVACAYAQGKALRC